MCPTLKNKFSFDGADSIITNVSDAPIHNVWSGGGGLEQFRTNALIRRFVGRSFPFISLWAMIAWGVGLILPLWGGSRFMLSLGLAPQVGNVHVSRQDDLQTFTVVSE